MLRGIRYILHLVGWVFKLSSHLFIATKCIFQSHTKVKEIIIIMKEKYNKTRLMISLSQTFTMIQNKPNSQASQVSQLLSQSFSQSTS